MSSLASIVKQALSNTPDQMLKQVTDEIKAQGKQMRETIDRNAQEQGRLMRETIDRQANRLIPHLLLACSILSGLSVAAFIVYLRSR